MGSLELCGSGDPEVFLVGGAGSGIPLYRAFARAGYGICCGVLQENDIEMHVAQAIAEEVIHGPAFTAVSRAKEQEAECLMQKMKLVADSGFPIGEENRENIRLLCSAAKQGKPVLSLRDPRKAEEIYGSHKNRVQFCDTVSEMVSRAREILEREGVVNQ